MINENEKEMKQLEKMVISVVNDFADDYGTEGVLDELFPDMTIGELVYDMYAAGLIPEDVLERFLDDE